MVKSGLKRRDFWVKDLRVEGTVTGPGTVNFCEKTNIWYVDKGKTSGVSGDGSSWDEAFLTITEAISSANDYDVIYIGPGFYTETATQTITQVGLKIIGCNSSGKTRGPCGMKGPSGGVTTPIITINDNSNDVEIRNIAFIATGAGKAIQLGSTNASAYTWRTHIHDCAFFGDGVGTYAIAVKGAVTNPSAGAFTDVAECVVEDCFFYDWITAAICTYGTRMMNKNNVIFLGTAGAIGIVLGTGRPWAVITYNQILGINSSSDQCIKITGDVANFIMDRNTVLNTNADAITQDTGIASISSENYVAVTGGVYSVFDTTNA